MSSFTGIPKEKMMDIEWLNNVWLPNLMKQRGLTNDIVRDRIQKVLKNRLPESDEEFERRIIEEAKKNA